MSQKKLNFITISLVTAQIFTASAPTTAYNWNYNEIDKWSNVNSICLYGQRQSPIAIDKATVEADWRLAEDRLVFEGYSGKHAGIVTNNGHTLVFNQIDRTVADADDGNGNSSSHPCIFGGQLPNTRNACFILAQVQFHWGDTPTRGAEHVIVNQSVAPMEVHFVHYNNKYKKFSEAKNNQDGIAIVAFLFDSFSLSDASLASGDTDYGQFKNYIAVVTSQNSSTKATIDFDKLIPQSARDGSGTFYRYNGSLTTPPCLETVTWTLFEERILVENSLLDELIKLRTNKTDPTKNTTKEVSLYNNFRPPQPLNNRLVTTNRLPLADFHYTRNGTNYYYDKSSPLSPANKAINNRHCCLHILLFLLFLLLMAFLFAV